jgi:hypothetical protein
MPKILRKYIQENKPLFGDILVNSFFEALLMRAKDVRGKIQEAYCDVTI